MSKLKDSLCVETVTSRMKGGRARQEDTVGSASLQEEFWGEILIQQIADGHGSHMVSNFLKKNVRPTFQKEFNNEKMEWSLFNLETLESIMVKVLRKVNISLQKQIENLMGDKCKSRRLDETDIEFKNPHIEGGYGFAVGVSKKNHEYLGVRKVISDGEAERLGVKVGWRVKSIDQRLVNPENITMMEKKIEKNEFRCIRFQVPRVGSTLVATFTFTNYHKVFALCVGDSRFMVFEAGHGQLVKGLKKIVDLADGDVQRFDNFEPCTNFLHKCNGRIVPHEKKGDPSVAENCVPIIRENSNPHGFRPLTHLSKDLYYMENDPSGRGFREYELWANSTDTNPDGTFIVPTYDYDRWTFDPDGLEPSRSFGDKGCAIHMGEIYICDLPSDCESWLLLASDGIEESIDVEQIPYYLLQPLTQLKYILDDHRVVQDFFRHRDWFAKEVGVKSLPEKRILDKLKWLEHIYDAYEVKDLFPSKRDSKVHKNSVDWLKKSFSRMSKPKFLPNLEYRVKFLMQSAYARLCFDNVSIVVQKHITES